jgi:hypothetical protein
MGLDYLLEDLREEDQMLKSNKIRLRPWESKEK